jgi:dTDP-4-dehydrorhamnose reductase
MKVLVTGSRGQLGAEVLSVLTGRHDVFGFGRDELDITDEDQVRKTVYEILPDVIIHCAAYTAVDLAETEAERAYRVNAVGTRNVASSAAHARAKIVYISTDYVFNGQSDRTYPEHDAADPINVYGRSKLAGELFVQSLSSRHFIVRTSWLFGKHGSNFVKTMIKLAREHRKLQVVDDQLGSPTYAADLASFLSMLIETEKFGIYHVSNSGSCSWYEFAKEIFLQAGITAELMPCTTEQFLRPAARPKNSVMDHTAMRSNGFTMLPPWQDALSRFLLEIGEC